MLSFKLAHPVSSHISRRQETRTLYTRKYTTLNNRKLNELPIAPNIGFRGCYLFFGLAYGARRLRARITGAVIVFAAASLKNALDSAAAAWQKETGAAVKISYAGSSTLAKQLEEDAPAQIFISADEDWMNYVEGKGLH